MVYIMHIYNTYRNEDCEVSPLPLTRPSPETGFTVGSVGETSVTGYVWGLLFGGVAHASFWFKYGTNLWKGTIAESY